MHTVTFIAQELCITEALQNKTVHTNELEGEECRVQHMGYCFWFELLLSSLQNAFPVSVIQVQCTEGIKVIAFFNLISYFTPECLKRPKAGRHTVNKWKLRSHVFFREFQFLHKSYKLEP